MEASTQGSDGSVVDVTSQPSAPDRDLPHIVGKGFSLRSVLRGTLTRFVPAGALIAVPLVLLDLELETLGLAGVTGATLAVGYFVALALMRHWLRADAGLEGRQSVVAGLVAPFALFCVLVIVGGVDFAQLLLYSILTGFSTATLMFFPWLRRNSDLDEDYDENARRPALNEGAS
jgi:hypothetical protein